MSTAMTIDRIAVEIVRVDMMAAARYAKEILEANRMEQPKTCLYAYNGTLCPIGKTDCARCGWDVREDNRRRRIKVVYDDKTALCRKIVGKAVNVE